MSGSGQDMSEAEFQFISDMVYQRARIVISKHKRPMLQGRLAKRLRKLGLESVGAYVGLLSTPAGDAELVEMLNAVTTNVTGFFREPHHFQHLAQQALPEILTGETAGRLRIWSAGCSTGQEPYSIAMTVQATLAGRPRVDARILATDLDSHVVAQAEAARYSNEQAAHVPEPLRSSGLVSAGAGFVQIDPRVKALVVCKQLNLMDDWPMSGKFDVVFCRNVVIYFDKPTQARLFDRIADLLAPGGFLYIGHSESLFKVTNRFKLIGKTAYRKLS